ncbi:MULTISPECIES: cupin domain-containing protein [unclassified Raoultella]|uniref:cupin domain-containing protein n=2 Tax=unclassified Raoultella TaxID=2627600 RepID=UPI001D12F820|nr:MULTISPECIES: cupin domain-containing protein [unclassified Raoultella]
MQLTYPYLRDGADRLLIAAGIRLQEALMEINSVYRIAAGLEQVWQSRVLGAVGNSAIKIIKMGGEGIAAEAHDDFDELLLVLEGALPLVVDGRRFNLAAGDYCFVQKGVVHHVPAGSFGTLLLVDIRDAPLD